MPNHVHLVAVPAELESLARGIGEAHRRYTLKINQREGWRGHLWQERFSSFIMEEIYLPACTKYVELNPVRAGLVKKPEDWQWSSAGPHMKGKDDILVKVEPLAAIVNDWQDLLKTDLTEEKKEAIRRHERTGRPLGNASFLNRLEKMINRSLKKQKPGPKKKN